MSLSNGYFKDKQQPRGLLWKSLPGDCNCVAAAARFLLCRWMRRWCFYHLSSSTAPL